MLLGLDVRDRETIAMRPEAFITYKVGYKCKHCGQVWSKIEMEEKPLPRDYVVDDEEKTDADAEVEDEAAREEEYAREQ